MFSKKLHIILAILCAGSLITVFAASNAIAGPFDSMKNLASAGSSGGGGSVSRATLDKLYKLVTGAESLLDKSVNIAFSMVANKEEIEKFTQRQKEIEKIQDPKERDAAMNKFREDQNAIVTKATEKAETAKKIESLDGKQKKLFGDSVFNVVLAALMDKEAVETSKSLSTALKSNPTAAASFSNDVPRVTNIAASLPEQAKKATDLGSALTKLAKTAKVEVTMPASAAAAPKPVDNF
jgi:hypothetical protein